MADKIDTFRRPNPVFQYRPETFKTWVSEFYRIAISRKTDISGKL